MSRRSRQISEQLDAFRAAAKQLKEEGDPVSQLAGHLALTEPFNPQINRVGNWLLGTEWSFWYKNSNRHEAVERSAQRRVVFSPSAGRLSIWGNFTEWSTEAGGGPYTVFLRPPEGDGEGSYKLTAPPDPDRDGFVVAAGMITDVELGILTTTPIPEQKAQSLLDTYSGHDPEIVLWLYRNLDESMRLPQQPSVF